MILARLTLLSCVQNGRLFLCLYRTKDDVYRAYQASIASQPIWLLQINNIVFEIWITELEVVQDSTGEQTDWTDGRRTKCDQNSLVGLSGHVS